MEYRELKDGKEASLLGFGTMRLPTTGGDQSKIDEPLAIEMIRRAIDAGVNYVDTAFMYHDGKSEVVCGKALRDGYREKVLLVDKMPPWLAEEEGGLQALFDKQLARTETDFFDLYLLHNVDERNWELAAEMKTVEFLSNLKAKGKIGQLGFSFHGDNSDFFKEVIDSYPWDFCQIQFNYMDREIQAGLKGLKYAGEKNIPVIIMEPLRGGKLASKIPPTVQEVFDASGRDWSAAKWALRWVANFPEVKVILSGMSDMAQVEDNIAIFDGVKANSLNAADLKTVDEVTKAYRDSIRHGCTACKYCLPCSVKINIPQIIELVNDYHLYNGNEVTLSEFKMFTNPKRQPSTCTACGKCEEHCPQHLAISKIMSEASEIFCGQPLSS
jgi:predicted aldo/keto reductase-like oxidoreductase